MPKGSARNMQRISVKAAVGMARPIDGGVKQPPALKQLQRIEVDRLARIRFAFEIESQIADQLAAGGNVGLLREKLHGVRNGTIEVPRDFRRTKPTAVKLADPTPKRREEREQRLYRSERELEADLADLARGKLTMTGIATAKGLLERFADVVVIDTLGLDTSLVFRIRSSAVFALAPKMSAADGLMLVGLLESRASKF